MSSAVPEYRVAYAIHSAALPLAATAALLAPSNDAPVGVLMMSGPTRCIQQLTWTPSVAVVEPVPPERIVMMALSLSYPAETSGGSADPAPAPLQVHPERSAPDRLDGASVKSDTEAAMQPTRIVTEDQ